MKIKEIFIDGFGPFKGKSFGPLHSPVVIMYGPNEAGKSTLLNFVRTILFGFPLTKRDTYYPALNGGQHGGNIVVTTENSSEYTIKRYVGPKGGEVSIFDSKVGEIHSQAKLDEICGHASQDLFNNIFAFSLDELQKPGLLKDENINREIYSVGMGTRNLPDLRKKIEKEMDNLYKPGGSKPKVNVIVRKLEEIDGEINKLTLDSDRYSELMDHATSTNNQIDQSQSRLGLLQRKSLRLDSMLEVFGEWTEFQSVEVELSEKKEHRGFPEQSLGELQNRLGTIKAKKDEVGRSEESLESAKLYAESVKDDFKIINDENIIKEISKESGKTEEYIKDLPERKSEMDSENEKVQKRLSDLGEGWDGERLRNTDLCSFPVTTAIGQFLEDFSEVKGDISTKKSNYETSERESSYANKSYLEKEKNLKGSILPKYTKEKLDHRTSLLKKINQLYWGYKGRSSVISNMDANSSSVRNNPWFNSLTCGAIFILVLLIGILTGQSIIFSALLSLLLSVVVWGLITYARVRDGSSRLPDIKDKDYVTDIRDIFNELGRTLQDVDHVEYILPEIEKENSISDNQIEEYEKKKTTFTDAKEEWEQKVRLMEDQKKVLEDAEAEEKKVKKSWKEWLTENRLPLSLNPDSMAIYQQQIQTGRAELDMAEERDRRYETLKRRINEYMDRVKPIADKHSELYEIGDPNSLVTVADRLSTRLQESKKQRDIKQGYLRTIEKEKKDFTKRQKELSDANKSLASLLETSAANDEEEYRQMAKDTEDRRVLEQRKATLNIVLSAKSGVGKELVLFKQDLSETSYNAIEFDCKKVKSEWEGEKTRLSELTEEKGRVREAIDQIFKEDKLSELRARKKGLIEQLSFDVRNWAKFKLADAMLKRGMEKYERESQPLVIRKAEKIFKGMTGGRYPNLVVPLGETRSILVMDENNSPKNPDQLSRGTREQLYLSLRLGLIQEYVSRSESLPIIIDDIFVNFDPSRAANACGALAQLSGINQILVFTCHPGMVSLFQENMKKDVQVIEIS